MDKIKGRAWRFGDHVDTDQIIPAERLLAELLDKMDEYVFEKVRPGLAGDMKEGDIILAGKNFGCGSSREHAPRALLQAGVSCVVAESFARIFYRNSINVGLPLVECKLDAEEGDELEIDFEAGVIRNLASGASAEFDPYPEFIRELLAKGGLMARVREEGK